MKESAQIALSYVRSHAAELGIEPERLRGRFHVHVPAGAVPKDGPSAGVTMTTALVSLLTDTPVRPTVGMTGEVTLQGHVLPIGGLKQKVLAAHRVLTSSMQRDWPIPGMSERLNIVILIVGLATVPWVALNWTVHSVANTSGTEAGLGELVSLWTRLTNCIFAFASFVVIALLQTGALRSVWQAQPNLDQAEQAKFTTTDVLMYGGFLAVMMAALAIPLLAAWQGKAKAFVNAQFPFGNFPFEKDANQGWAPGRELLEKTLHLNVSVLANPLTALSIFTPLIASLLAAFLPELGTS